ncbi:hypothetical protein [Actinomadura gamaensis]|uniref:Secreted protein/lipoprotein n=1 Tax=Actinomadura gamaensis TaxID=1763541 RepID=A0ABV9TQD5_9ACTN
MRGMVYAALALCLAASACTDRTAARGGVLNPVGTVPSRFAAAPPTAPEDVLTRYRRFHEVAEKALATGDASQIPTVATGAVAAHLQKEIARDRRKGVVLRGHAVPHPHLAAVRAGSAQLVDCLAAAGPYTFRRGTGKRVGGAPRPHRSLVYATMSHADGTWKVAELATPKDSRC